MSALGFLETAVGQDAGNSEWQYEYGLMNAKTHSVFREV
jgi:hypothetical protein